MSDSILHDTSDLRKLIMENPQLPLVVLADGDTSCAEESAWWYQSDVKSNIGEILDCDLSWSDKIYSDRQEFEDDLYDYLYDEQGCDMAENFFEELCKDELARYEPYWKKVITIRASN